ncbi:MAG: hypothetical protein QM736_21210 [Vicinamibacterales bacterium]
MRTLTLTLALLATPLGAQQLPPPFPRTNATLLFQNDRINIYDIVWPKGQPTALHRHVYDQVGTYYARGGRTITTPDGQARSTMTEVGVLSTTRKGTTHVEEGNTVPPLQAVFIELRNDTSSGLAAVDVGTPSLPRDGASTVLDDDRVLAWDVTWTAGPAGLRYRAARETVIVWLGTGRMRVAGGAGEPTEFAVAPGTMRHLARGASEILEAASGAPRAMIFEIK